MIFGVQGALPLRQSGFSVRISEALLCIMPKSPHTSPHPRPVPRPHLHVVAALVVRNGDVMLTQRLPGSTWAGSWEFPGGKREPGEDDRSALARELAEELDTTATIGLEVGRVDHAYEEFDLTLVLYEASLSDEPKTRQVAAIAWVPIGELGSVPMPPADVPLVKTVKRQLEEGRFRSVGSTEDATGPRGEETA